MKIAVITNALNRTGGGVFEAVRRLAQKMLRNGTEIDVIGVENGLTQKELDQWLPLKPLVLPCRGPQSFGYAPGLAETIQSVHPDSIEVHGIWQYLSVAVLRSSRKLGCSYVVHPHGMLDPWAVKNSYWKKKLVDWLYERRHLAGAACIRALCRAEAEAIRGYGLRNPVCIVPNAIDLPCPVGPREGGPSPFPEGRRVLLYLGRIHPKKGLSNLIDAWDRVQRSEVGGRRAEVGGRKSEVGGRRSEVGGRRAEWLLAIAGWDQGGHERQLRQQVADRGLTQSVVFLGPQFDECKAACYRHCDAFILPSLSEGLPMVILEAWAYGKPVVMTPECNLDEGFARNAAIRIETSVEGIAAGIRSLLEMTASERAEIGDRGRTLVKEKFSWPCVAQQLRAVHEWTLSGGRPPESVQEVR